MKCDIILHTILQLLNWGMISKMHQWNKYTLTLGLNSISPDNFKNIYNIGFYVEIYQSRFLMSSNMLLDLWMTVLRQILMWMLWLDYICPDDSKKVYNIGLKLTNSYQDSWYPLSITWILRGWFLRLMEILFVKIILNLIQKISRHCYFDILCVICACNF